MCPRLLHLAAECNAHTYDMMGRLTSVADSQSHATTLAHDPVGLLTQVVCPTGITETRRYDDLNRLTEVAQADAAQTLLASYAYTCDPVENRLTAARTKRHRSALGL